MGVVRCPFCSSKNNKKIVHTDSISPKESTYTKMCNVNRLERNDAVLGINNFHMTVDYDGSIVRRRSYDRFCFECNRPFYLLSNYIIGDIKYLTFIIETKKGRWKYSLCFDVEESYYNIEYNYITKANNVSLTPARKLKILNSIKNSNLLKWNSNFNNKNSDNIKWSIYLEFINNEIIKKEGKDCYPEEWGIFIDSFIRVFKDDIFKSMK